MKIKKLVSVIMVMALVLSVWTLPWTALAEIYLDNQTLSFKGANEVFEASLSHRSIRTKVLSDGTVAAVYYKSGDGIYYAESNDGGYSFTTGLKLISNATDSVLATKYLEGGSNVTQVTLAKEYVDKYSPNGRGRLEAQNPNLIELDNGNIMVFYRYNTYTSAPSGKPWDRYYSSICYQIYDKSSGTWSDSQVMVETDCEKALDAGGSNYGFWEPDPVYIGEKGSQDRKLIAYYADAATPGDLTKQHIRGCVWSDENNGFDNPSIMQNGTLHNSRDGMSVVTKLSDGNYAMVFESTKTSFSGEADDISLVVKMSVSKDGLNWSEPVNVVRPEKQTAEELLCGKAVCSAPYAVTLPDGRVAISCQTTDRYSGVNPGKTEYELGVQVAISSKAITYEDFSNCTRDEDKTLFFADKYYPGTLADSDFSKSSELMIEDNKLYVYYSKGTNSVNAATGNTTNSFGAIEMAVMDLTVENTVPDYGSIENYVIYNSKSEKVTQTNGVITMPTGTTNMIHGVENYKEEAVFEAVKADLYDESTYTVGGGSAAKISAIDAVNKTINFTGAQGRYLVAGTDDMTTFKATATIGGNDNGLIYAGFGFNMDKADFKSNTTFNSKGHMVILNRSAGTGTVKVIVRSPDGSSNNGVSQTFNNFLGTGVDETLKLTAWSDSDYFYVEVTNADATKTTGTLKYSRRRADVDYPSGGFMLASHGTNTISDFELYSTAKQVDASEYTKAKNLRAKGTFKLSSTVATNYIGFALRVQKAENAAPGLEGYALKLVQSSSLNSKGNIKIELARYGTNSSGEEMQNLGNKQMTVAMSTLGLETDLGATVVMEAEAVENMLYVTLSNADESKKTEKYEFDLAASTTASSVTYTDYYADGGFGLFKTGSGDMTVSDVEFTIINGAENNIDSTKYTLYAPENSEGLTVLNKAFVSNDATLKKAVLKDAFVTDFEADATFEIGSDGELESGIIFRAADLGDDVMTGYCVALSKANKNTGNYGHVELCLNKWARTANGDIAFMGIVDNITDTLTLNSVYPDAENDILASAGKRIKLNVKVMGKEVTASFDVLDSLNKAVASSGATSFMLDSAFEYDKDSFNEYALNTMYNGGRLGLSISTLGKICDFNLISDSFGTSDTDIGNSQKITVAECENGSVYTLLNCGAAATGDKIKIGYIPVNENKVDKVYYTVDNGEPIEIPYTRGEGYIFNKPAGCTSIYATFGTFAVGNIDKSKVDNVDTINATDLVCMRKELTEVEAYNPDFVDVNGDGFVDLRDLLNLKKIILNQTS